VRSPLSYPWFYFESSPALNLSSVIQIQDSQQAFLTPKPYFWILPPTALTSSDDQILTMRCLPLLSGVSVRALFASTLISRLSDETLGWFVWQQRDLHCATKFGTLFSHGQIRLWIASPTLPTSFRTRITVSRSTPHTFSWPGFEVRVKYDQPYLNHDRIKLKVSPSAPALLYPYLCRTSSSILLSSHDNLSQSTAFASKYALHAPT